MRGQELREFLIELESRFPDFSLSSENVTLVETLEREYNNREINFYEILSILNAISGRNPLSSSPSPSTSEITKVINLEKVQERSKDEIPVYKHRIKELEDDLLFEQKKVSSCQLELSNLKIDLVKAQQKITRLEGLQNFGEKVFNDGSKVVAAAATADLSPEVTTTTSPTTVTVVHANFEKMKGLIQSLLYATQLLSKDRSELYKALFQVLQGGRISNKEIRKRLGLEQELIQVYNDIVLSGSFTEQVFQKDDKIIMSRPYAFVIYSLLLWGLGVISAILAHEYVLRSDVLFLFPTKDHRLIY